MGFLIEMDNFIKDEENESGQFNAFLAGPIIVVVGVIVVILGIVMINALASTSTTAGQAAVGNQPNVQSMISFIPYAGIGVVIGGILLTIVTVFGSFGNSR